MIPALLIWLTRKYGKRIKQFFSQRKLIVQLLVKSIFIPVIVVLLLLLTSLIAKSQVRQCEYKIVRNSDEIGKVKVEYVQDSNKFHVKVTSDIRFRVLFRFSAYIVEEALFSNSLLQYSSIYRKWNGSEKVNRQRKLSGSSYEVTNFGKSSTMPYYPVSFHILQLYLKEPVNVQRVYSENHQKFFELQNVGANTYKLILPDGDYNIYHYEHGICTKVDITHSFFNTSMVLQK